MQCRLRRTWPVLFHMPLHTPWTDRKTPIKAAMVCWQIIKGISQCNRTTLKTNEPCGPFVRLSVCLYERWISAGWQTDGLFLKWWAHQTLHAEEKRFSAARTSNHLPPRPESQQILVPTGLFHRFLVFTEGSSVSRRNMWCLLEMKSHRPLLAAKNLLENVV